MRKSIRNSKTALSPVISGIILIAVTVAVGVASTTWLGSVSFSFMATEQININACHWAEDSSYADLRVMNFGTDNVILDSARVNNNEASSVSFISGNSTLSSGEEAVMRVYYSYSSNTKYRFSVTTSKGHKFLYISTAPHDSTITFKMEWGVTVANDTYKQVNLQNNYVNPVIVCTPKYDADVPRTVRVTGETSQSFRVKVQNPSGATCPNTEISYLVVEEGVWTSPIKLEAVKYSTNTVGRKGNWNYETRDYQQTYSGNVVVMHQVMSDNDQSWITSYVSRMTSTSNPLNSGDTGFRIALNGAEASSSHANETISYIIFEEGADQLSGTKYDIKRTGDSIQGFTNSPPYNTAFVQSFDNAPSVVLSAHQEADGGDGGWAVVHTVNQTQAGLAIDEDQESDNERNHTTETCGFLAFESTGSIS